MKEYKLRRRWYGDFLPCFICHLASKSSVLWETKDSNNSYTMILTIFDFETYELLHHYNSPQFS